MRDLVQRLEAQEYRCAYPHDDDASATLAPGQPLALAYDGHGLIHATCALVGHVPVENVASAALPGVRAASQTWATDPGPIHLWFSLSYASYLVLPRSVLQSMPQDWQAHFCTLLSELGRAFGHLDWPEYAVNARDAAGRYRRDPIPHYDRGRTILERRTSNG